MSQTGKNKFSGFSRCCYRSWNLHWLILSLCCIAEVSSEVVVKTLSTLHPILRISGGKFSIGDEEYRLRKNEGGNHLHGGVKGFNVANWAVHVENGSNAVTFRYEILLKCYVADNWPPWMVTFLRLHMWVFLLCIRCNCQPAISRPMGTRGIRGTWWRALLMHWGGSTAASRSRLRPRPLGQLPSICRITLTSTWGDTNQVCATWVVQALAHWRRNCSFF